MISSWWARGGGVLSLLALLTVGLMRPAPAAAGSSGGSGTLVLWGEGAAPPADLSDVISVAGGFVFAAALRSNGTVVVWNTSPGLDYSAPADLAGVTAVTAGNHYAEALKSDGTVVAWGSNSLGQLDVPPGLTGVRAVSAGGAHSLALKDDGTVVGWGWNLRGQLDQPAGLRDVIAVSAGATHSVALKSNGTVVAWGQDIGGQLDVPAGLTGVTEIAAGELCTLALKSDGTVVAWGANNNGQLDVPPGLTHVVAIANHFHHCLALKSDGTVVAWGWNEQHQTEVPPLSGVTSIAAGLTTSFALRANSGVRGWGYNAGVPSGLSGIKYVSTINHTLAVRADGSVAAWGSNEFGKATVPAGLSDVVAVSAGDRHSLALKSDGTVVAWGSNAGGQSAVPVGLAGVKAISAGANHNLVLKSNGTVVAWGIDTYGQATVPAGLEGVVAVAAGHALSLALKADGTVVAWGIDALGQATVPAGLEGVVAISPGRFSSLALKSDGTVVAWGDNSFGQLTPPAGLTGVKAISAGLAHHLVLLSDGTVAAWGSNSSGASNVPAGLAGVSALTAGLDSSFVVVGNQRPTLTSPGPAGTWEDVPTAPLAFTVADDGDLDAVTVSAVSSDPDLVQSFSFGGSGANRTITVIPAANAHGSATITLTASDGQASGSTTFAFTVAAANDPPSFTIGSDQTVAEDTGPQSVPGWATQLLPGPTTDEFAQSLTFEVTANSNSGLLSAGPAVNGTTGELSYTPAPNAHGTAVITLQLRDDGGTDNTGQDTSATQTFTVTVTAVNDAPTATGQSGSTAEDTQLPLTLAGADIDGDALSYTVVDQPEHGALSGSGAQRTYTPAANYYGSDRFTFKVRDGAVDSNIATVILTVTPVNDLPVATGESYSGPRGTLIAASAPGLLGNDADVDGDALTAQLVATVTGGALTFNANGSFSYTPRIGFSGTDTFTYRAHDGTAAGNTVTVSLQVSPMPPASTPDAQVEATGTIPVPGGNAGFTLTAQKTGGRVMGSLTYTDPVRTRSLSSTELTSVVVTGRRARVFGKGKLANGTVVDFVVDVEDVAEPGRNKDRFQIETGGGSTTGAVLSVGNVTVRPQ